MSRFAFLNQEADQARVPVALLSGFLGSGKTTLVNALLRDPRMAGTAVAVNEFGEIPLDHDLIDHGADKTVVMANGCLCCNLAGDMEDAVMRLFSRREGNQVPRFDRLIIEPSGLADPAPIAQAILRNPVMSRAFRLEAIVCTVDALFAEAQLARHRETRKQLALADRLVLTKTDLTPPETIEPLRIRLRDHNPIAPMVVATHGEADAAALFPPRFFNASGDASGAADTARSRSYLLAEAVDGDHQATHASLSLTTDHPLQWRPFETWLRGIRLAHAEQILRIKAMLQIDGVSGPVILQGVHHVLNAPVEQDHWPQGPRRSRLVLIADPPTIAKARTSWTHAMPGMIAGAQ